MYRLYKQFVSKVAKNGFGAQRREKIDLKKNKIKEQQRKDILTRVRKKAL